MKKLIFAVLTCLIFCFALCSCGGPSEKSNVNEKYAGEWKANQISSVMDGETTYKTVVVLLNEDGTGSYKDKQGTWEVSDEATLTLTLTNEKIGMVFEIGEEEGKTILKYYQDVFYKASEFVEK